MQRGIYIVMMLVAMVIVLLQSASVHGDHDGTKGIHAGVCRSTDCPCTSAQIKEGMENTAKGCRKKCRATKAWEDYKRDLKIVLGVWEDADADGDRALDEFNEAGSEIITELGIGGVAKTGEETVPKIAELTLHKTGIAKGLLKALPEGAETATVGVGVVVPLAEDAAALYNTNTAIDNLNYATQSQAKMYAQADEKWKQALADLARAKEEEQQCEAENKALDEKLKAEQDLEKAARHYMEQGGLIMPDGRVIDVYFVGNKEFRNANEALEAAKQLVTQRRQSGYLDRQPVRHRVVLAWSKRIADSSSETYVVTSEEAKKAIKFIEIAEGHIHQGATITVKELKLYQEIRERLLSIRTRIGTG